MEGQLVTMTQLRAFRALDEQIRSISQTNPARLKELVEDMDMRIAEGQLDLERDYYDKPNGLLYREYYEGVYHYYIDSLVKGLLP